MQESKHEYKKESQLDYNGSKPLLFRCTNKTLTVDVPAESQTFLPLYSPKSQHSCTLINSPSIDQVLLSSKESSMIKMLIHTIQQVDTANNSEGTENFTTKLPNDFYESLNSTTDMFNIFMSFRLQQDPYTPSNRRYSFGDETIAFASPKDCHTHTKTNPFDSMCGGHIPKNSLFSKKQYCNHDNNYPGAFPLLSTPCPELLDKIRIDSPNVIEIRIFSNLICYSELVNVSSDVGYNELDSEHMNIEKKVVKHYIQEYESLYSIIKKIKNKTYEYVNTASGELFFTDQSNNNYLVNINNIETEDFNFKKLIDCNSLEKLLEVIVECKILNQYVAIFYQYEPYLYMPVMVLSGENGFHITGDIDAQQIGMRFDMPIIAYETFKGDQDEANLIISGLQIFHARLQSSSWWDFSIKVSEILRLYRSPNIRQNYNKYLTPEKQYINYQHIEYYSNFFIHHLKQTSQYYVENPKKLEIVGKINLHHLVVQFTFAHPLFIHGTEDMHPSDPDKFGLIESIYKNTVVVTTDWQSYLSLLLFDRELLQMNRLSIHPSWLFNVDSSNEFKQQWYDILEIQALNEASIRLDSLNNYKVIITNSFKNTKYDTEANITIINNMFKDIRNMLSQNNSEIIIQKRLDKIYKKYENSNESIRNTLKTSS